MHEQAQPYNRPPTRHRIDVVEESLVALVVNVEGNTPTNPSGANGVQNSILDSIDSTGTMVERRRNTPSISWQRSIDESLQLARKQELDVL